MTNGNQHIPSGYKPSPLGIIPEDWEVKRLGEVCTFLSTNTLSRNQLNDTNGEVRNIHYGDVLIKYPSIIDVRKQSIPFVNQEDYKESMNDFIEDGDVVLADTAEDETVGKACEIANVGSEKILSGLHTMLIRPQKGLFSPWFLGYQVNSVSYRKQLNALIQGIKVCSLGKQAIANTYFAIPPFHEQQSIVSVLSLWDTAIAKQTALIEQLTLRKRGLMQQLLTGKKRLKGFGGEWKDVRLGEIGTAYGGLVNKNKEDFENGNALFITYMNVFSNGKIDINNLGQVRILPSEKQEQVQYGDIFFTVSSETPEEVGMASVLLNEVQNTYLNSFCFGYRLNDFKSIIPAYASYLFRGDDFRKKMYKIAQGSTRFNISKTEVLNMRITIPSIEEQNTIASVLVDVDKEIEIQKQKLAAMQEQKKGLMQVLLTGKKRINK